MGTDPQPGAGSLFEAKLQFMLEYWSENYLNSRRRIIPQKSTIGNFMRLKGNSVMAVHCHQCTRQRSRF